MLDVLYKATSRELVYMMLYRTVIAPGLSPNSHAIRYCKGNNNGCGVYLPEEVLDRLGLKKGSCLKVYKPVGSIRRCIVLVPQGTQGPSEGFKQVENRSPSDKCSKSKDLFVVRPLDANAKEMWLLDDGGVVRIPIEIAREHYLITKDCYCKGIPTVLYIIRSKRWIVVEIPA